MDSIEIRLDIQGFEKSRNFVEDILEGRRIHSEMIDETMMIFESIFQKLQHQEDLVSGTVNVWGGERMGNVQICMGFDGRMFDPFDDKDDPLSPENRIISAYADKIGHVYHTGYNKITISVKRRYRKTVIYCAAAILLALALYTPIHFAADASVAREVMLQYCELFEKLFSNAILMIGAPVTFLSLIRNLTNVYVMAERDSEIRRIAGQTLTTSVTNIVLAAATAIMIYELVTGTAGIGAGRLTVDADKTIRDIISGLVPSNIFEPFITISPMPLIILSILFTYACCSVGKYFNRIRTVIDEGYVLFSRALTIIMVPLPFFVFVAFEDLLVINGYIAVVYLLRMIGIVLLGLVAIVVYYVVSLLVKGVKIKGFVKNLLPLISENFKINSAIDAVPYNIRYCSRAFGADRRRLERLLPVLAQVNLDGNCYIITFISMILLYADGHYLNLTVIATIGLLTLFLSIGAPNQPGSCLIGLIIILSYLNIEKFLPVAIISEFFFGGLINIINVIGDIVIVARTERMS